MRKLWLLILFAALAVLPVQAQLAVHIGGVYSGPFSIDDYYLHTTYTDPGDNVFFDETNRAAYDTKAQFGFTAGISYFFNYKMGIGVNVSFLKTEVDVTNHFNWDWEWWNGVTGNDSKTWGNIGNISATPVSVNLIFRAVSNDRMKMNFFAGPTFFLTKVELDGNGGYADGPLLYQGTYYIDWYDLPLEVSESKSVFGGNAGVELEYQFSESMNFYVSAAYYFSGELTLDWLVKPGGYTGEFGQLVVDISNPDLLPGYSIPVKLSTFALSAGIKVYL